MAPSCCTCSSSHGSSFPEYYLLCTAGYRVNLERMKFIDHAAWEFQALGWPDAAPEELNSAFDRLVKAGLMTVLTEVELQVERERRAASALPELNDAIDYRPGHVDFTELGYRLYRTLVREIRGDAHMEDAGFNLDSDAKRFDVYAVNAAGCTKLMDTIQGDGDAYTGAEGTRFVDREIRPILARGEPTDSRATLPGTTESFGTSSAPPNPPLQRTGLRPAAERQYR